MRYVLWTATVVLGWMLAPKVALAHEGQPLAPHDVWVAWNWEPLTLAVLILSALLYGRGIRALWRAAGPGRGVQFWRVGAFFGGLIALFLALVSPLEAMTSVLFSAHMTQHLLLILVAPPLLLLGRAETVLFWALPQDQRPALARWMMRRSLWHRIWRTISRPWVVWLLYALGLWIWHLPLLYQAALRNELVHVLEHGTFFGAAMLLWWTLAHCQIRGSSLSYGMGILLVFTTALHGGLLGWLLTFTTQLWYPAYAATTLHWGLAPLEDQQLAGAIMWAPAGLVYALAALVLLASWLQRMERHGRPAGAVRGSAAAERDGGLVRAENHAPAAHAQNYAKAARAECYGEQIYEV